MKNALGFCEWLVPCEGIKEAALLAAQNGIRNIQLLFTTEMVKKRVFLDSGQIKKYKEAEIEYGIKFHSVVASFFDDFDFSESGEAAENNILETGRFAIDSLKSIDIPVLVCPLFCKSSITSEERLEIAGNRFKSLCAYAEKNNVIIASENILSVEENRFLCERVRMDNFKLLFDIQNCFMLRGKENAAYQYDGIKEYVTEIHVKDCDEEGKPVPVGTGITGARETLEHICQSGFEGPITLENDYRKNMPMFLQDINYLKSWEGDNNEKQSGFFA